MPLNYNNPYDREFSNTDPLLDKALKKLNSPKGTTQNSINRLSNRTATPKELGIINPDELERDLGREYNVFNEDIAKARAEAQSGWKQGLFSLAGGIAKGLATAVEDVSYIADLEGYGNVEKWSDNWLAEYMKDFKSGVDEALPIYRKSSETFDFSDSGFYWSTLQGIVDSAVGFGLPGGIVAKGVASGLRGIKSIAKGALKASSLAGKTASAAEKGNKFAKRVDFLVGELGKVAESQGIKQGTNATISGYIQNHAEGTMMALEAYENTKNDLEEAVRRGDINLTEEQIEKAANQSANSMYAGNQLFLITNAFALHGLAKKLSGTDNMLSKRGFANRFKDFGKSIIAPNSENIILQGAGEALEEIGQNVIQMESVYQGKKDVGYIDEKVSEDTTDRLLNFATSDQALLEGIMGFFGGGPQRILSEVMSGNLSKSAKEEYDKRYNEQQARKAKFSEFIEKSLNNTNELLQARDIAFKKGEFDTVELMDEILASATLIKDAQLGTLGELKRTIEAKIADGAETLGEEGINKLRKVLELSDIIQKEFSRYGDKANIAEIAYNRVAGKILDKHLNNINTKITDRREALLKNVDKIARSYVKTFKPTEKNFFNLISWTEDEESNFAYKIEEAENLKNPYDKTKYPKAHKQFERFKERVKKLPELKDLKELIKEKNKLESKISDNVDHYSKIVGEDHLKEYIKEVKERRDKETENFEKLKKFQADHIENVVSAFYPGNVYKSNTGIPVKMVEYDHPNNRIIFEDIISGKKFHVSKELADKKFKNEKGELIQYSSAAEAENAAKKASATNSNVAATEQGTKTSTEKVVAKSPINTKMLAEDIEPTNEGEDVASEELKALNKEADGYSKNPFSAAYYSSNNTGNLAQKDIAEMSAEERKRMDDISEYLENPNNKLVGTTVRYSIEGDLMKGDVNKLAREGAIKITLLDSEGNIITNNGTPIELHMHLPGFLKRSKSASDEEKLTYENTLMNERQKIVSKLINGEQVYSTIEDKSPGYLQPEGGVPNTNVTEILEETNVNNIELLYVDNEGALKKIKDYSKKGTNNNTSDSNKLGTNKNAKRKAGGIFTTVTSANGKTIPYKLHIANLNSSEANLLIDIYLGLGRQFTYDTVLGNAPALLEAINSDSNLKELVNVILATNLENKDSDEYQLEDITIGELKSFIVHEGKKFTKDSKFPLYLEKNILKFGTNTISLEKLKENRSEVLEFLTTKKIKNINKRALNIKPYKEYLFRNNILVSPNNKIGTNGVVFAQPRIDINPITKTSAEPVTKNVDEMELTDLGDGAVGTPMSAADIEAVKKADIERRRQEELRNSNLSIKELSKQGIDISTYINAVKERDNYLKTIDRTNPYKTKKQTELEEKVYSAIDYVLKKGNEELKAKINAKYDAELAALERQATTQPQTDIEANQLTAEEADWLYDNLKLITKTYNSSTLDNSKDTELKKPLIIGDTKVTHIDPSPGDTSSIIFERPSGRWMIQIEERNGKMHPMLYQWKDVYGKGEFSFYISEDSEANDKANIEKAGLNPLIKQLYTDTNIPNPGTRLGQFQASNALQQKYGLKRTYKDIVKELAALESQSSQQSKLTKFENLKRGSEFTFQLNQYGTLKVNVDQKTGIPISIDVIDLNTGDYLTISKEEYNAELTALEKEVDVIPSVVPEDSTLKQEEKEVETSTFMNQFEEYVNDAIILQTEKDIWNNSEITNKLKSNKLSRSQVEELIGSSFTDFVNAFKDIEGEITQADLDMLEEEYIEKAINCKLS